MHRSMSRPLFQHLALVGALSTTIALSGCGYNEFQRQDEAT